MCEEIYYDGFGCLNPNKIGIKLSSWKQISIINGFFESMKASKRTVDLHFNGSVDDLSFKLRRQHFDSTGPMHSILCGSSDTVVEKLGIGFLYHDKNKNEVVLEFYNADYDSLTLTGELQLAEKWCNLFNEKISEIAKQKK